MTKLVLIRHGETRWNKQARYCGRKDIGLSPKGRTQAKKLSKRLNATGFDKIYSSDRNRARQTARTIFNTADICAVRELAEIDFGVLEGLRHEEIMKKHADAYGKWLRNPYKNNIPEAETMNAFKKRVTMAFKKIILMNPDKTVAIVCHGGVIGVFVNSILKVSDFWRYIPSSASITIVECMAGKAKLKKFNDTKHLIGKQ